jgi:phage terminase large subunit GpA-like protein
MTDNNQWLEKVFGDVLDSTRRHLSNLKPSDWYEANMVMPLGSAFPGPFSFDLTPFWKEPLDCVSKDHPAKEISIMKSAQSGGTAAVLLPIVGYTISQHPGNMMYLVGHTELSESAFVKIDHMIQNCGLRDLIGPSVVKKKNSRSGDTNNMKEYPGGILNGGSVTNHNLLRQYDVMVMIVDDFDAAPMFSKAAGSTRELVQQRTAAFMHKKKIIYVSSPQLLGSSNIGSVFRLGDQRYWNVPCPCCGSYIVLKWEIEINNKEKAGITWKTDQNGHLDVKSVGYVCQNCSNFFSDSKKYEMNKAGMWVPTAIAKENNHWSYQLSGLYSPPGFDDWATLAQKYINANPEGGKRNERKMQTFYNVNLGLEYEKKGASPEATGLLRNIRKYPIGTVPEWMSIDKDGNGKIIMLTCACDLNGTENDARVDYEVMGWSESGSSYSIKHGHIGTFVFREGEQKVKADREHWTYEHNVPRSVWPEIEKVIGDIYVTDTGRKMKILITGVDTGHFTKKAYDFIDKTKFHVVGVRGDKENQYRKFGIDMPVFKPGRERPNLFMLDVNNIKDIIYTGIDLTWNETSGDPQPPGFMNFPTSANGLYSYQNFFKHYEAEHRIVETKDGDNIGSRWVKKSTNDQNHFWDVYVYNYALKEIWAYLVLKEAKPPLKGNWAEFVAYMRLMKNI